MGEKNLVGPDSLADASGRRSGEQADSFSAILEQQQKNDLAVGEDTDDGIMGGHPALEDDVALDVALMEEPDEPVPAELPDDTPSPAPADQRFQFQSQDEAERAHEEAMRRMHEATEQTAAMRQRMDLLERELYMLRTPVSEVPVSEPPVSVPEFDAKEHWRHAYRRIEALDPDATDFEDQRLNILAAAQSEHAEHLAIVSETRAREVARTESRQIVTEYNAQTEHERKRVKLLDRAAAAGLDVGLPTPENPLGGLHLPDLQAVVEQGLYPIDADEDTAIQAVIATVAQRHDIQAPSSDEPSDEPPVDDNPPPTSDATRRVQARNTPMERAGQGRTTPPPRDEDVRPMTMEEALEQSMEPRQVRNPTVRFG